MFKNVTIISKIIIGFVVLFCLLLGVSGFAYFGIDHSRESFNQYRELARDSVLAGRLQANMLLVRFHTKRFLETGSEEDVKEYEKRVKLMLQFIEESVRDIKKPERAERVALIRDLVDDYVKSFDKVVVYKEKRDEIIYRALDPSGLAMRKAMTDIVESAYKDGDLTASYFAGRTQEHLLLGRLYATKFLDTNDIADVKRFNEELETRIEPAINRLKKELQDPKRIALFKTFQEKRNIYLDNFKNLVVIIRDRNRIINSELDRIGPIIADAAENIKLSVKKDQDILGPRVKEKNEQTILRIIYICIASLLIAVILGVLIVRAIKKPIGILVDTVGKFGKGNLDIRMDIQSGDEIGILSKSFNSMADQVNRTSKKQSDLNWLSSNRVDFDDKIRGIQEIEILSDKSLDCLVTALDAQVGAFYISDKDNQFKFVSGYACKKEEIEDNVFALGEGLIGQAAKKGNIVFLKDVPEDYITPSITSGIGKTRPKHIIATPIMFMDSAICVIELAKLEAFSELQIEFLNQIKDGFGIMINAIFANAEIKLLLNESRELSDNLKIQQENLQERAIELAVSNKELDVSNKELDDFAYIVSHDLKAPLRAIHNYADFLQKDLKGKLEEEQEMYLEGLREAVVQSETYLDDVLELSRVGKHKIIFKDINIGTYLQELLTSLDLPSDIDVILKDDWPVMQVEPTLLRQIFQNLITNGIKFNHSPQKTIEFGWQQTDNERYEVFVKDNGIGIESRFFEKIFRPFQRLHTSEEYEGTGIGLAAVARAANRLEWPIRVESEPGEGSAFFITIPNVGGSVV